MKIGVSIYSFCQYIDAGKLTVTEAVEKAAQMGFDAIEFTELFPDNGQSKSEYAKLLADTAKKNNIEISAYVCGADFLKESKEELQKETDRIKGEIDIANQLGVKLFRYDIVYNLPMGISFDMMLDKVVPYMKEIAEYASKYGITTMIENHGRAFQDSDRVVKVYNSVNHKNFALLVDIGNFMCADEVPVISVSKTANLAAHVHIKDFIFKDYYSKDSKEHCFQTRGCNYILGTAAGYGDVKVEQCLKILQSAGYDGYLDIEYEGPEECIEALENGLSFLKNVLKKN